MNIMQIKTLYERSGSIRQKSNLTCGAISINQIGGKEQKTITIREIGDPTRIYCVDFYNNKYTINGSDKEFSIGNHLETFVGDYQLCDSYNVIGSGVINVTYGDAEKAKDDIKRSLGIHQDEGIGVIAMNEEVLITSIQPLKDAINMNASREYYKMDQFYLGRNINSPNRVNKTIFVKYMHDGYAYKYNKDQIALLKLCMSNYLKLLCSKLSINSDDYVLDYFGFDHVFKEVKHDI